MRWGSSTSTCAAKARCRRRGCTVFFRTDEIDTQFNSKPFVSAFAEYRPDPKTTVRFDLDNLLQTAGQRERLFFTPDRTAPFPTVREFRDRNSHVMVTASLRRGF